VQVAPFRCLHWRKLVRAIRGPVSKNDTPEMS
jgi:hypothetical protein